MIEFFNDVKNYKHFTDNKTLSEKYPPTMYDYYYFNIRCPWHVFKNRKKLNILESKNIYTNCVYKSPGAVNIKNLRVKVFIKLKGK